MTAVDTAVKAAVFQVLITVNVEIILQFLKKKNTNNFCLG
jgi:hypothetical protein